MARFYARFDQASESNLDSDFFDKRTLGADSASGALLRNGLIASRSALSTAMHAELDLQNHYGTNGPIIPREINNITQAAGALSWNNVYTSSVFPGVITPADYRTRPTASITTADTASGALVARSPVDSGSINENLYLSASAAVTAVLNSFSSGQSPLTTGNQGNNVSRTLHSVWHDKDTQYFAYDNFTPGTPQNLAAKETYASTSTSSSNGTIYLSASREYLNDFNSNGSASIVATLRYASSSGASFSGANSTAKSLTVTVPMSSLSTTGNDATRYYTWSPGVIFKNTGSLLDGQTSDGVNLHYSITYYDATISSSAGPTATLVRNSGALCTVNGVSNNACFIKIGSA